MNFTLGGRTLLLRAKRILPEYITTILWPFAMKCHKDWMNNLVHWADGRNPYQTLLDLDASLINVKDFYTFGCPCCVLYHCLQSSQGKMPKWDHRSWLGIYVGQSITITCIKCWIDTSHIHWHHHSFMLFMMVTSQQCHVCVQDKFQVIGQI